MSLLYSKSIPFRVKAQICFHCPNTPLTWASFSTTLHPYSPHTACQVCSDLRADVSAGCALTWTAPPSDPTPASSLPKHLSSNITFSMRPSLTIICKNAPRPLPAGIPYLLSHCLHFLYST